MYSLVVLGSLNTLIDILVKLVERAAIYTVSNLLLSASLLLAIPLIQDFGLWSIVIANAVGITAAIGVILLYMRNAGYAIDLKIPLLAKLGVLMLVAIGIGQLSWLAFRSDWIAGVFTGASYLGLLLLLAPISQDERTELCLLYTSPSPRDS